MIELDQTYRNSHNGKVATGAEWYKAMRHGNSELDEEHLWYEGESGELQEV